MSMNGLERIVQRILTEARTEADAIIAAAEAECKRISEDWATRAEKLRDLLHAHVLALLISIALLAAVALLASIATLL